MSGSLIAAGLAQYMFNETAAFAWLMPPAWLALQMTSLEFKNPDGSDYTNPDGSKFELPKVRLERLGAV